MASYELSKPLKVAVDKEITALELRDLTGEDLYKVGVMPFTINGRGETEIKINVIMEYLAQLSGYPLNIIKKMSPLDINKIGLEIIPDFFDTQTTNI